MFWVAGMILEAWDIELERVHSFAIILSENDTVVGLSTNYQLLKKLVVMSKNVHFHYIKLAFFDITPNFSTTNDGRKTNNTSYECPT